MPTLIEGLFGLYYHSMAKTIYVSDVPKREFMFMTFDGTVKRHISFRNLEDLRRYLVTDPPLHAYYSVSLYMNPTAPMDEKGMIRAELLFDIDSTDFNDEVCEKDSLWRCKECGTAGKGVKPRRCPKCGSDRLEVNHWLNERCMELAKMEVRKLVDILSSELDVDIKKIAISYTGNRGFHVRVTEGPLTTLGRDERREICFFIMGRDFDPFSLIQITRDGMTVLPSPVGGVLSRAIKFMLTNLDDMKVPRSLRPKLKAFLGEGKPIRLNSRERKIVIDKLREAASKTGVRIDWMVTTDTGRLTRIPNSLHGKTGFRALSLTFDECLLFNPFTDAIGLPPEPEVPVRITLEVPKFHLKEDSFGPFKPGEEIRLPGHAGIFLVLRGRAQLLES